MMYPRLLALLTVVLLVSGNAEAQTWEENRRDFHARLARQCPEKHLDYMFQSTLLDVFDSFRESLPTERRIAFARIVDADVKTACATIVAGAGCAVGANIRAATELKLLPEFVKTLCGKPFSCPGSAECSTIPQS